MKYGPRDVEQAFENIAKGTSSFEVRAALEHHLLTVLKAKGNDGVAALLAALPRHEFGSGEESNDPREVSFRSPDEGHPSLVVRTFLTPDVASVNVSYEAADTRPVEPDPRHRAFYEVWEKFLSRPDPPLTRNEPWPTAVFLVGLLESEVMNGGLGQYLANTDGAFLRETVSCLETIGARKTAAILQAAGRIGSKAPSFGEAWEADSQAFESLDQQFLTAGEDLAGLAADRFLKVDASEDSR